MIDYKKLTQAIEFYQSRGYNYIEVPWAVDYKAWRITSPEDATPYLFRKKFLVASGEQSFIHLLNKTKLPKGKYVCLTPCFRDDKIDRLHQSSFMKVELIDTRSIDNLEKVTEDAVDFLTSYTEVNTVKTVEGYDIVDRTTGIELGSYGIRSYNGQYWIYGTGLAEPRLSIVLEGRKL